MIKISENINRDLELIKFMLNNQQLNTETLKFLINYLISQIEEHKK